MTKPCHLRQSEHSEHYENVLRKLRILRYTKDAMQPFALY